MKGIIVDCKVSEGPIAAVHGIHYRIKRLVIPGERNLVITPQKGNLYAWYDDHLPGTQVDEVDVPAHLVASVEKIIGLRDDVRLHLTQQQPFNEFFGSQ